MKNTYNITYEPYLTESVIDFVHPDGVADKVSPRVPGEYKGNYDVHDKSAFIIPKSEPREGMKAANTVTRSIGSDSYETKNYPLRTPVTYDEIYKRGKLGKDAKVEASFFITETMAKMREKRIADLIVNGAGTTATLSGAPSNDWDHQWDDEDNRQIFKCIRYHISQFIKKVHVAPSGFICNPDIEFYIATYAWDTRKEEGNVLGKNIGLDPTLPEKFMGMDVGIARMLHNTARPKASSSMSYIWGNTFILYYVGSDPESRGPHASKTFDAGKDKGRVTGVSIAEYPGNAGENGIYIEGQEDVAEKITCADAIYVIDDILGG